MYNICIDIIIVIRSSIHEVVKQAEVKRLTQTSSTNLKEQLWYPFNTILTQLLKFSLYLTYLC